MKIGGWQKFSLIDYPGKIAAVIFTQGCNFRCPYCQNPELVVPELYSECIPETDVMAFLYKRREQLEGVVVTGGEPTIHKDLPEFIKKIRELGFAVKLDTNGSNPDVLEALLAEKLIDYIAMDIKAPMCKYQDACGVKIDTEKVKRSVEVILKSPVEYEFRTTLVKPLCVAEDLPAIREAIDGARRYTLQNFVRSGKVLNKRLLDETQYAEGDIARLKALWDKDPYVRWYDLLDDARRSPQGNN